MGTSTDNEEQQSVAIEISDDEEERIVTPRVTHSVVIEDDNDSGDDPVDYILKWDTEVRHKFGKSIITDNDKVLIDLMTDYIDSLEQMAKKYEENKVLREKMTCHMMFLHSYFSELECSSKHEYLEKMERILTIYCNSQLEAMYSLKKSFKKREWKEDVIKACQKVIHMLIEFLYNNEEYILHVLIKLNIHGDFFRCKFFLDTIFKYFILRNTNYSDEAFCRYYILLQRWKQVRSKSDWEQMETLMYQYTKREAGCIEQNDFLRKILMPKTNSLTDVVFKVFGSCRDLSKTYFEYIASKRNNETTSIPDGDLNFDNVDDALMSPTLHQEADQNEMELEEGENNDETKMFLELEASMAEVSVSGEVNGQMEIPELVSCKIEPEDDDELINYEYGLSQLSFEEEEEPIIQFKVEPESDDESSKIPKSFLDSIVVDENIHQTASLANEISAAPPPPTPEMINQFIAEQHQQQANTSTSGNQDALSEFNTIVEQSDLTNLNVTDFLSEMDKFTNNGDSQFVVCAGANNNCSENDNIKKLSDKSEVKCLYQYGITTPPSENVIRASEVYCGVNSDNAGSSSSNGANGEEGQMKEIIEKNTEEQQYNNGVEICEGEGKEILPDDEKLDEAMYSFFENVRLRKKLQVEEHVEEEEVDESRKDTSQDNGLEDVFSETTMDEDQFCSQKLPNIIEKKAIPQNGAEELSPVFEGIDDIGEYYNNMLREYTDPSSPSPSESPAAAIPSKVTTIPQTSHYHHHHHSQQHHHHQDYSLTDNSYSRSREEENKEQQTNNQQIVKRNGHKNHSKPRVVFGENVTHYIERIECEENPISSPPPQLETPPSPRPSEILPKLSPMPSLSRSDYDLNENGCVPAKQKVGILKGYGHNKNRSKSSGGHNNNILVEDEQSILEEEEERKRRQERDLQRRLVEMDSKFGMTPIVKLTRNIFFPTDKKATKTPQRAYRIDYDKKKSDHERNKQNSTHYENNEHHHNNNNNSTGPLLEPLLSAAIPTTSSQLTSRPSSKRKANGNARKQRASLADKRKNAADPKDEPPVKKKPVKRTGKVRSSGGANKKQQQQQQNSNPVDIKQLFNGVRHFDKPFRDFFEINDEDKT